MTQTISGFMEGEGKDMLPEQCCCGLQTGMVPGLLVMSVMRSAEKLTESI